MSNLIMRCIGCGKQVFNDNKFCDTCIKNNDRFFKKHTGAYDIDRIKIMYGNLLISALLLVFTVVQ